MRCPEKTLFLTAVRFVFIFNGAKLHAVCWLGRNGGHRKISIADPGPVNRPTYNLTILASLVRVNRSSIIGLRFPTDRHHAFRCGQIERVRGNTLIADARPDGESGILYRLTAAREFETEIDAVTVSIEAKRFNDIKAGRFVAHREVKLPRLTLFDFDARLAALALDASDLKIFRSQKIVQRRIARRKQQRCDGRLLPDAFRRDEFERLSIIFIARHGMERTLRFSILFNDPTCRYRAPAVEFHFVERRHDGHTSLWNIIGRRGSDRVGRGWQRSRSYVLRRGRGGGGADRVVGIFCLRLSLIRFRDCAINVICPSEKYRRRQGERNE